MKANVFQTLNPLLQIDFEPKPNYILGVIPADLRRCYRTIIRDLVVLTVMSKLIFSGVPL